MEASTGIRLVNFMLDRYNLWDFGVVGAGREKMSFHLSMPVIVVGVVVMVVVITTAVVI